MKKFAVFSILITLLVFSISFKQTDENSAYYNRYLERLNSFEEKQNDLLKFINNDDFNIETDIEKTLKFIQNARNELKILDFWIRYFESISYRQINGPLPVEWETEVFEKFEAPYRRGGAGLTLATQYLQEENISKDSLYKLIFLSNKALQIFRQDSILAHVNNYHTFYLCNRLFLLNLAAIYTTGFECPDSEQIIPELRIMLAGVQKIYSDFNRSFPNYALPENYLQLYKNCQNFIDKQPSNNADFNHFIFIKDYVNPLFSINQQLILDYKVVSKSLVDYSLNKRANSIFDKALYNGQNPKGIFRRVDNEAVLADIEKLGKLLFHDPILSGNNQRSCASCHNSKAFFTDTAVVTNIHFNKTDFLPRNSPTLINTQFNHLSMLDGKFFTLQHQTKDVITNAAEMGGNEKEILAKVLSCKEYKTAFQKLLPYTPTEKEVNFEHISAAITMYYSKFSKFYSPFDEAVTTNKPLHEDAIRGFNIFMGKAQCASCHFVPQFNGVKPPYTGSEFEVIGVPADKNFTQLSADKGRFIINAAPETLNAFRTGTVRNASKTMPYMHNGVFRTLDEVIDFYNDGGGVGRGLQVENQTLAAEPLNLTQQEKKQLIAFMNSLTENIEFEELPTSLPISKNKNLNNRKVGGTY